MSYTVTYHRPSVTYHRRVSDVTAEEKAAAKEKAAAEAKAAADAKKRQRLGKLAVPVCDRIDALLAKCGSFQSVQKFRTRSAGFYIDRNGVKTETLEKLMTEIFRIEWRLRELAQREEGLKERYLSLKLAASSQEDRKQLSAWLEELEAIPKEYWLLERQLYEQEALLPRGGFLRAYSSWRSNPKWYLHPVLVNDCAGKGGCCGRGCGCCEKRGQAMDRRRSAGHCAVECRCCAKSRGFDVVDTKNTMANHDHCLSVVRDQSNTTHLWRFHQAYYFGIGSGRDAAPRWT